ncbi:TonB-dependent receptor [candidate division KSB1 bacterium]|nr:TonB-dependent receptor [candidate division KSB1 bacterium]
MCKKILFVAVFIMFVPILLFAGTTGKLVGKVVDKDTKDPLPAANVIIEGTTMGAATNLEGEFFIINVPAGTYTIRGEMIGYTSMVVQDVRVKVDLTAKVNFELEPTVLEAGETVTVTAERPLIQVDQTSSRTITGSDEIDKMSVDSFQGVVATSAGIVVENGQMHARGGRTQEVAYLLDNSTNIMDPMSGAFDTDIPELAIEETSVMTGGFSAEYGNAQSAVVNVVTKDGGPVLTGTIRYTTSALDGWASTIRTDEVNENRHNPEFSLGGPVPFFKSLGAPGDLRYFVSGWYENTDGRFLNQHSEGGTYQGKLTYKITPSHTLRIKGLYHNQDYDYFDNLWKKTTYEDLNETYKPYGDLNNDGIDDNSFYIHDPLTGDWFKNGILDTEDKNGNNFLDPGEDLNGNNILDREDLNFNGSLDSFNMLDHLSNNEQNSNQIAITWTHQLSSKTFYELHLDRYYTKFFMNANEYINEDRDGDGKLDNISENVDINGDGTIDAWEWLDFDNDGYFDKTPEDLNGNNKLDPFGVDLYTDWDSDGFVDASQKAFPNDRSKWMSTSDIPYKGEKSTDGFYTYGSGLTWDRRYWYVDESTNWGVKFDVESQVTSNHNLRAGVDVKYREIFRYDATDRYGYGEKFTVYPNSGAFYIQDKMEYQGMILNIGMRYDYFDANWDKYPNNLYDPTWSTDDKGHEDLNGNGMLDAGEDTDGDGYLDQAWDPNIYNYPDAPQIGDIKNPISIQFKDYWSPRFGIAYPITERDVLHFSYGSYFQEPLGGYLFRNLEFDLGGGFPIIGNPNLKPERTTAYEVGLNHQISNSSKIKLTGFYKDISDLTDTRPVYFTVRDWYGFYYNADYGNIRGFELEVLRRPEIIGFLYVSGRVNYTYQVAKNKSSQVGQGYLTEWAGQVLPRFESYTDWDQRHTINANLDLRIPQKQNLFGTSLFNDLGVNLQWYYGSGTRWTPPKGQDKAAPDNTGLLPSRSYLDLRASKRFHVGRLIPSIYLDIRNVFDTKNIIAIADPEWYNAKDDPEGKYNDPSVYDRGRLTRLGLRIDF